MRQYSHCEERRGKEWAREKERRERTEKGGEKARKVNDWEKEIGR